MLVGCSYQKLNNTVVVCKTSVLLLIDSVSVKDAVFTIFGLRRLGRSRRARKSRVKSYDLSPRRFLS